VKDYENRIERGSGGGGGRGMVGVGGAGGGGGGGGGGGHGAVLGSILLTSLPMYRIRMCV